MQAVAPMCAACDSLNNLFGDPMNIVYSVEQFSFSSSTTSSSIMYNNYYLLITYTVFANTHGISIQIMYIILHTMDPSNIFALTDNL